MKVNDVSFHDGSLMAVHPVESGLELLFELTEESNWQQIVVQIEGITSITREGVEVSELEQETEDGEVLKFWEENGCLKLLVIWTDFKKKTDVTRYYEIRSKKHNVFALTAS